ncbi:MAG: Ku protein [Firmicutes bacterium]|nr:Ku protein [Bacillota bacterium]
MAYSYKSAISFGLVYVPVTLHLTVRSRDIGFNMLHKDTGERIRYLKTCDSCKQPILGDDIVKGFQYEKGKYVTITDKEFEAIKSPKDKSIEIAKFVKLDEIDPIYFEKSYYVNPTGADKAFQLILEAIQSQNKVGIAKTVLGSKEQVVALRAINGNMVLYTMHFHDELAANPTKKAEEKISDAELKLAKQIIDNMTTNFNPKEFKDEYREKLESAIQTKINGRQIKAPNQKAQVAKIINLMDALKASVEGSKKNTKANTNVTRKSAKSKSKTA